MKPCLYKNLPKQIWKKKHGFIDQAMFYGILSRQIYKKRDFIDEAMFLRNSAQADFEKNMASSFHQK